MAGAKNKSGGKRLGAGRKSKAEEEKARSLSIAALINQFGSELEAFNHLAKEARQSFPHLKMLFEYGYGKPTETIDANVTGEIVWNENKSYVKP